jgi:hypothetical protein
LAVDPDGDWFGRHLVVLGKPPGGPAGAGLATVDLSAVAGRNVRFVVEAVDAGSDSLLEAGLDDLKITQT